MQRLSTFQKIAVINGERTSYDLMGSNPNDYTELQEDLVYLGQGHVDTLTGHFWRYKNPPDRITERYDMLLKLVARYE